MSLDEKMDVGDLRDDKRLKNDEYTFRFFFYCCFKIYLRYICLRWISEILGISV